jgi:hypothetical protein
MFTLSLWIGIAILGLVLYVAPAFFVRHMYEGFEKQTTTKEKEKAWSEYVLTSGEYEDVTLAQRRQIARNPLRHLDVSALLEIDEVYAIYKGNQLIGYFAKISDHVQAAIYQDGAWYEVFFDSQFTLVESFDRSD